MKTILVDLDHCNGCFNCQLACKDEHCGNDWRPIAAPQPTTGQFWCRVDQRERGRVPVVKVAYTPTFCGMCDDAPCLAAATDGAVYRREDGLVVIDPEKARGQRAIAEACPLGLVYWNDELEVPQKCTGCAHLLDDGWTEPRCVDACATGVLRYVDAEEAAAELAAAEPADELAGLGSHVLYLHKPRRFVAGTVADRTVNEVVIGAAVTVRDEAGAVAAELVTDEFGDFYHEGLDEARYRVSIEAAGYEPVELVADCTERDVVFDDVLLKRPRA